MKNKILVILLLGCTVYAQAWEWWPVPMAQIDTCHDTLTYIGGMQVLSSSNAHAPTWLHANRNGEIALLPHSGNLRAGIVKPATRPNRWFDYDFGVVLSGRIAGTHLSTHPYQIEGTGFFSLLYTHTRLYIVDITIGIKPLYFGGGDEELTCGSLLLSNNAHPFPRISVGIDQWTPFPGLFGYMELRGGLTHGWLNDNNGKVRHAKLHHKYVGIRAGGKLPVNLSYEFHHAAMWGGYRSDGLDLGNDFDSFRNIFWGRGGGATLSDQLNKQGNHMLSQLLCLTAKGKDWHVDLYWQDFQEDGGINFIGCRANSMDGRWGISAVQNYWPFISGMTFEIIQTTDQSGPWHDRDGMVFGGNDSYYSNSSYPQGWTYFGQSICSTLLSPTNSRIWAYHTGIKGDIYDFKYRVLCTHARNYGTYNAPKESQNTAFLLEIKKIVPQAWGLEFGISLAYDFGTQHGNTFGTMITISKQGITKQW